MQPNIAMKSSSVSAVNLAKNFVQFHRIFLEGYYLARLVYTVASTYSRFHKKRYWITTQSRLWD